MTVELILGDCLEVMRGMADGSVDAVITDPPYGISYQSAWRTDKESRFAVLNNDDVVLDKWLVEAYRVAKDTACLFCFCRWDTEDEFKKLIIDAGWNVKSQVIWDRVVHGLGDLESAYAPQHDNAWFAIKGKYKFQNGRPKSVYRAKRVPAEQLLHPTQKPESLMKMIVGDLTQKNDVVLDCFAGVFTTGVACVQTNRNFIGIEIDPDYFAIAERRIKEAQMQPTLWEAK